MTVRGLSNASVRRALRLAGQPKAIPALMLLVIVIGVTLAAPLSPYDPSKADFSAVLQAPSVAHPFGTDPLGRDVLTRIAYGGRLSLAAGALAVTLSLLLGVVLGATAGWIAGIYGLAIVGVTDLILAFPLLLLAVLVIAVLGPGLFSAMIAVGIAQSPFFIRVTRASVMTVSHLPYVTAARAMGVPPLRILVRHVLPNAVAPLIVQTTLALGTAILTIAGLGFLGLGAQPPAAEWGVMVSEGREYLASDPLLIVFPGAAIALTVLSLNLLGDTLRDALDPRLRHVAGNEKLIPEAP